MTDSRPNGLADASGPPAWHLFVPKLVTTLRQGYGLGDLRADALAGLTVAIVALPLAMALAIASGTTPDKGLLTAVVAGFLISAFGGSRFQIGGPTGAFVVVVFNVIQQHGYDGLVLATFMAGLILVVAGLARLGTWVKYIPEPVVTGFTAGIALIIFTSQIRDIFGLDVETVPADFLAKWPVFWEARDSADITALTLTLAALAVILLLKRYAPRVPGFLAAIAGSAAVVYLFNLPVETIGSRFGEIPAMIPMPSLPQWDLEMVNAVLPSAFTIAFLAGVESLLSAMVADGMTGRRHRSNCELVAQGIANTGSALFGGMPATGAIARTATNVKSGGRTPVAGILHAVFVLAFMLLLAPLAVYVPLAGLAAVLVMVAWNMSEIDKFRHLMSAPPGDRLVLLMTFGLTVLVDLTVAIQVGVVLGAILFVHRMAQVLAVHEGVSMIEEDIDDFTRPAEDVHAQRRDMPEGVEVFQLRGPLFFGTAGRLTDMLESMGSIGRRPKILILRMREVPMVDSSGVGALTDFVRRCRSLGITVIMTGVQDQPRDIFEKMGLGEDTASLVFLENYAAARAYAATRI